MDSTKLIKMQGNNVSYDYNPGVDFLVEYNSFTSLIFTSFDVDIYTNTDIDFARFIQAIWNYCTLDEIGICACVFNLYDRLDEGYIHKKDVCRMIQELYGSDYKICEEARM